MDIASDTAGETATMTRQRSHLYRPNSGTLRILRLLLRLTSLTCALLASGETIYVDPTALDGGHTSDPYTITDNGLTPTPNDISKTINGELKASTTVAGPVETSTPKPTRAQPPESCQFSGNGKIAILPFNEREDYYRARIGIIEKRAPFLTLKYGRAVAIYDSKQLKKFQDLLGQHWLYDYPVLEKLKQAMEFVIALWVPFVLGIVGNYMVLYTVIIYLKNKSATNILLCSLALTDFLTLLICVPLKTFTKIKPNYLVIGLGCSAIAYIQHVFFHASILLLATMAVERYLTICHPLKSKLISTPKNIKKAILVSYVLSFIVSAPTFLTYGERYLSNQDKPHCPQEAECVDFNFNIADSDLMQQLKVYPYMVVESVVYFGAILLLLICYGMVANTLFKSIKEAEAMKAGKKQLPLGAKKVEDHDAQSRMRIVKMLIVVVIFFVACWGPIILILVLQVTADPLYMEFSLSSARETWILRNSAWALAMGNSCVNPFIYLVMSRSFRRGFKASIGCGGKDDLKRTATRQSQMHSDVNSEATRTESVAS
ncbi:galanin receptor 2a-like [Lineus longissimus]|uniref:galanin receptor 2a-like n=1 Tax=Lineus longissimus TaxID=88925 RepID=UPI002B4F4A1C